MQDSNALALVCADVELLELEPFLPRFIFSLRQHEKFAVPHMPKRVRRSLNILAAYCAWITERNTQLEIEHRAMLQAFAARRTIERNREPQQFEQPVAPVLRKLARKFRDATHRSTAKDARRTTGGRFKNRRATDAS